MSIFPPVVKNRLEPIPSFTHERFPLPLKRHSYNDDIYLEPYQPALLHLSGGQRKGIHEPLDRCSSREHHVSCALGEVFPLSSETPLPPETIRAIEFIRSSSDEEVRGTWASQLRAVVELVKLSTPEQCRWNANIPESISAAAGKFQIVAVKKLLRQLGVGGEAWLDQFAFGFPITGKLSQRFLFPQAKKSTAGIPRDGLFSSAAARFRERAAKSGMKNAAPLWDEAMEQVKEGWLLPPVPLSPDGKPLYWKSKRHNVSFRFGVLQADKLRACDDLKHSMTNLACTVETPIQLLSWDHIAQVSSMLSADGGDWVMFKADHKAAYKQLPIDPADQETAIIALRHPSNSRWYGFVTRTLIFGSVAAVLHYNVFSRIIVALVNRYLGIPLLGYFDDFAAIIRKTLGREALAAFTSFCTTLGIQLKEEKSEVGPRVVFLGLLGSFPCAENGWRLSISLTDDKRRKWSALLSSYLKEGRISHRCLEKLIGRLLFSQTAVFGKFARTQLRPLYQKFHSRHYSAALSPFEKLIFRWWRDVVEDCTPRVATPRPRRPHWIIYTDAATDPPLLCALLFHGGRSSPALHTVCSARAPLIWSYFFRHTALIYGLEMLALVLFFEDSADLLRGSCCWVYLDNNNCLAALVRGDSNTGVIAILVARFWQLAQRYNICVWMSRVRSDLNPADLPTRGKSLPFRPRYRRGFRSFRPLSIRCRAELSRLPLHKPLHGRNTRTVRKSPRRLIR